MLAGALAAGCATPDSFSYLQGERWRRAELNAFDLTIVSIDGSHRIQRPGQPLRVEPGTRRIVVQGPPAAGFSSGEQRTLTLEIQPCMHYWLEARKSNSLSQDFEPRVNRSEPISGCAVRH
jgi:hypothetical protein